MKDVEFKYHSKKVQTPKQVQALKRREKSSSVKSALTQPREEAKIEILDIPEFEKIPI